MFNTYDNCTLNSKFRPNIELRVKLSYVFNIVPYGIYMLVKAFGRNIE